MRDYLAIPGLYYDSTDKLFVAPWGRTKDCAVFQAGPRRRKDEETGVAGQRRCKERTRSCSFLLSPFLSLLLSFFLFLFHITPIPPHVESGLTARDSKAAAFLPRPRESRAPSRRPREKRCRSDISSVTRHPPRCAALANSSDICPLPPAPALALAPRALARPSLQQLQSS